MSKRGCGVRPTVRSDIMRVPHVHKPRLAFAGLIALGWVVGCLDDRPDLAGPDRLAGDLSAATVIVSDPVAHPLGAGAAHALSGATGADPVYVSLPPGTIPNGGLATIRNIRTGSSVPAVMVAGGFDPVAIEAVAGDTLAIEVQLDGGEIGRAHV